MKNEKNEIETKGKNTILNNDIQDNVRKITSLDLTNEHHQDILLSSIEKVDKYLKDMVGSTIEVIGHYIIEREKEQFNDETEEVYTIKSHTLILFDKDWNSYVTGSEACFMSYNNIISIKGIPTEEKPIKLDIINVEAEEKGHHYLKVKIHIDKK